MTVRIEETPSPKESSNPETWVDLYADGLFRYALSRTGDRAIAEELVQDTFVAALSTRVDSRFRGESTCKTWLTGILKHKTLDYFRKKYRYQTTSFEFVNEEEIEDSFDAKGNWRVKPGRWASLPQDQYEQQEFMDILVNCIDRLGQLQADAFRLREFSGEETKEICKVLTISATNYWVLMHRARLSIRRCMESHWPHANQRRAAS